MDPGNPLNPALSFSSSDLWFLFFNEDFSVISGMQPGAQSSGQAERML